MRPGSIDDVIAAQAQALRTKHDLEDRRRAAADAIKRLTKEIEAQDAVLREIREDVLKYNGVAA